MLIIIITLLLYILALIVMIRSWDQPERILPQHTQNIFLSVIIPARDEPELSSLISDLENQSLNKNLYEIIVVDDHSHMPVKLQTSEVQIIHLAEDTGKKAALTKGIQEAKGNVIVTIDSDCRTGRHYLKKIYKLFSNYDVVLSPGLIKYQPVRNLFEKMQAMETAAIMGAGVAMHKTGSSFLSNGANLAFKKDIWESLGGYKNHSHIPSGDDIFFVQEVFGLYPEQIVYRTSAKSVVSTEPNKSWGTFFHQRLRWAGKWRHYNFSGKLGTISVFIMHLIFCAGIINLFKTGSVLLIGLFIIKMLCEAILIYKVCKKNESKFYPFSVALLQPFYSPYVVLFGITSNFISYKWRGRRHDH